MNCESAFIPDKVLTEKKISHRMWGLHDNICVLVYQVCSQCLLHCFLT